MQLDNVVAYGLLTPSGELPKPGWLQSGYFKGLKDLVRSRGCDPRRVLECHNIEPESFEDPCVHIECTVAVNLLHSCSVLLNDRLFGLHLAERQDPDAFGCAMALARAAPDLRQALQSLVEFVPVVCSPEAGLEVVEGGGVAEMRWWTPVALGDGEQQVHCQGLLLILKTLKMLARERFRPKYATLTCGIGRAELQTLQDRLGCKVAGKAKANALAFSSELLDTPIPTANRLLFRLLQSGLMQLREAFRAGFVEQVEGYVRQALMERHCSVDDCARQLGTSPRTLQKRLMRMGIKFSDIVQSERIKLAKQALLWTDQSLDEIAFRLGYSEQTSFGRAFKRATGVTPQTFRSVEQSKNPLFRVPGSRVAPTH